MKTVSKYQQAKVELKNSAKWIKEQVSTDKPYIRMYVNDMCDLFSKDLNLSEYQRNLLSNYACKLHPKN